MRIFKLLSISILSILLMVSCDKEEDNSFYNYPDIETSNISKPTFDKYLTTTDYDGVSFRCRFKNGGDIGENMTCIVHWRKYASKPSTTPKASDMTNHESMRRIQTLKTTTTFDKSHAGFNGGNYLYYYFECSNSKGTTKTDVTFTIIPRS